MRRGAHPYNRDDRGPPREGRNGGYGPIRDRDAGGKRSGPLPVKERVSRTLFVRNINYDTTESSLRELMEKYGEIKRFFNLIDKRGMAFITFYDSRSAEKCKEELQNTNLKGRPIDVHYALPKEDGTGPGGEDDSKITGTLFISMRGIPEPPPNNVIKEFFEKWGEVREVRDCKNSPNQKFVEYFDIRDCEKAFDESQGAEFEGGTLDIKHAFALSKKEMRDLPPPKRSRDRDYNRSPSPDDDRGAYGRRDYETYGNYNYGPGPGYPSQGYPMEAPPMMPDAMYAQTAPGNFPGYSGYPSQQGYVPPLSGYPAQMSYPTGYPSQGSGYPSQGSGYPSQGSGYPSQMPTSTAYGQPGVTSPTSGVPGAASSQQLQQLVSLLLQRQGQTPQGGTSNQGSYPPSNYK